MIISKTEFLYRASVDHETLEVWIEEQWLIPQGPAAEPAFSEADLARAALIRDLQRDLGVNAEGVGVILHLVDQIHSLRQALGHKMPGSGQSNDRDGAAEAGVKGEDGLLNIASRARSAEPR
jgi:chaperone modulatory protein CbpM